MAMRFECKRCRAVLSLSLATDIDAKKLRVCPNCTEPWTQLPEGSSIEGTVKEFLEAMKRLRNNLKTRAEMYPDGLFSFAIELDEKAFVITRPASEKSELEL